MGSAFKALGAEEKAAINEHVQREYDALIVQQPTSYVSRNAQSNPEEWQERARELIASDPEAVKKIIDSAARITGKRGFTLIELSIVLVIIGLIVGGVLVGQDLIRAAGVRATISQIEKFNTAANTLHGKYGYLPGDIPAGPAAQFGFIARGTGTGQGDGNGIIEAGGAGGGNGLFGGAGEELVFWVDLSTAGLIEGGLSTANFSTSPGSSATGAVLNQYLPQAKLGGGNYIYAFSGGWGDNSGTASNGINYFGINAVTALGYGGCTNCIISNQGLTVSQAYAIDRKVDDGLPLTGNVLAAYIWSNNWGWNGAWGSSGASPPNIAPSAVPRLFGAAGTCFDDNNNASIPMTYSVEISNGSNVNCGLTFQMQSGSR